MDEQKQQPQRTEYGQGSGWKVIAAVAALVVLIAVLALGIRIYDDFVRGGAEIRAACQKAQIELLDPDVKMTFSDKERLEKAIERSCK